MFYYPDGVGVQRVQFNDFTKSGRFTETMENKHIFDIKARYASV